MEDDDVDDEETERQNRPRYAHALGVAGKPATVGGVFRVLNFFWRFYGVTIFLNINIGFFLMVEFLKFLLLKFLGCW